MIRTWVRNQDLALVWTSSAISTIGTRTLGVAYPLLALAITGSPTSAGWAGFALTIPILVFYIPGGVLVDRIRPRSIMLFADLARALTVTTVLVALIAGGLHEIHIYAAAALEGSFWVLYTLAETSLLPSLVQPVMMRRTLAKSEAAAHLASLAGRPAGGYLFGLGTAVPFALNTALFFVSVGLFSKVRRVPEERAHRPDLSLNDLLKGFRTLKEQPFLLGSMLLFTLTNLIVNTLIMIIVAGSSGMSSLVIGLVLAAGGVGGVLGSATAFRLKAQRSSLQFHLPAWVLALGCAAFGSLFGLGPLSFATALFITGFTGAMSNVSFRDVEVRLIPPHVLARVVGVSRLASHGALCLAAPLGGLLVTGLRVEGGTWVLFGCTLLLMAVARAKWVRDTLIPPLPVIAEAESREHDDAVVWSDGPKMRPATSPRAGQVSGVRL